MISALQINEILGCDGCGRNAVLVLLADRDTGHPHKAWLRFCTECHYRTINALTAAAVVRPAPEQPGFGDFCPVCETGRGGHRPGCLADWRPAPEQPEEQHDEIGTMTATEFQAVLNAKTNWPKPEQQVHNHGIDPSCKETAVNGRLVGECLLAEEQKADHAYETLGYPDRCRRIMPNGWCDRPRSAHPEPGERDEIGPMTATEFQIALERKDRMAADHPWRECGHRAYCKHADECHWWTHELPYCPLPREAHPEAGK